MSLVNGRGEGMEVSHLLFANDTFILYNANKKHMKYLSLVFMWFKAILALELKINLEKIKFILAREVANVHTLAKVLGCKVGILLTLFRSFTESTF